MKKSKTFKTILCIVLVALIAVCAVFASFSLNFKKHSSSSSAMLEKQSTRFSATEDGSRISDIPFEKYVSKAKAPENAVLVSGLERYKSYKGNTEKIQKAIDDLGRDGGCVVIPEGVFPVLEIVLKENVSIFFEDGAVLLGISKEGFDDISYEKPTAIISGKMANNSALLGNGKILFSTDDYFFDAEESTPFYALETFNLFKRVSEARKRLKSPAVEAQRAISLERCKGVTIDGISIEGSCNGSIYLKNCKNTTIKNLVINNRLNTSGVFGIHIEGGISIDIKNCFIATTDDGIKLESGGRKTVDVSVSDCTICSFRNCFEIGSETRYNIRKISVRNCFFFNPDGMTGGECGILIASADGSKISEINFESISMDGISSPFALFLGDRLSYKKSEIGSVHDISFKNIDAKNVELPSLIVGNENKKIYNINLENINATYRDTEENLAFSKRIPNVSNQSPSLFDFSAVKFAGKTYYYSLPCFGLYLLNTENVSMNNFNVVPRTANTLPLSFEN